jgi:hypothetical protein
LRDLKSCIRNLAQTPPLQELDRQSHVAYMVRKGLQLINGDDLYGNTAACMKSVSATKPARPGIREGRIPTKDI